MFPDKDEYSATQIAMMASRTFRDHFEMSKLLVTADDSHQKESEKLASTRFGESLFFVALYFAERRFIRKARPLGVPRQLHRLPALEKSRRGRLRTGMERTRMFSGRIRSLVSDL